MMWLLVVLLGIYLRELRTENIYGLLSSLYFVKRGFFMILLLVILLGIYLRELRTENIYLLLSFPLFRKEGAGGDSLFQSIQNQFPHHFNMGFFCI